MELSCHVVPFLAAQMENANNLGALCMENEPIRMVIVDSIITLFRYANE
jgi:hypothetical protein